MHWNGTFVLGFYRKFCHQLHMRIAHELATVFSQINVESGWLYEKDNFKSKKNPNRYISTIQNINDLPKIYLLGIRGLVYHWVQNISRILLAETSLRGFPHRN